MLRIALSSIVPNFMLLSKSTQLFHISAQLKEFIKIKYFYSYKDFSIPDILGSIYGTFKAENHVICFG